METIKDNYLERLLSDANRLEELASDYSKITPDELANTLRNHKIIYKHSTLFRYEPKTGHVVGRIIFMSTPVPLPEGAGTSDDRAGVHSPYAFNTLEVPPTNMRMINAQMSSAIPSLPNPFDKQTVWYPLGIELYIESSHKLSADADDFSFVLQNVNGGEGLSTSTFFCDDEKSYGGYLVGKSGSAAGFTYATGLDDILKISFSKDVAAGMAELAKLPQAYEIRDGGSQMTLVNNEIKERLDRAYASVLEAEKDVDGTTPCKIKAYYAGKSVDPAMIFKLLRGRVDYFAQEYLANIAGSGAKIDRDTIIYKTREGNETRENLDAFLKKISPFFGGNPRAAKTFLDMSLKGMVPGSIAQADRPAEPSMYG